MLSFSSIIQLKDLATTQLHNYFGTGELKYPALFGLSKEEIGKGYEATETKREKARFGILD